VTATRPSAEGYTASVRSSVPASSISPFPVRAAHRRTGPLASNTNSAVRSVENAHPDR
jgi:hypothetical protein